MLAFYVTFVHDAGSSALPNIFLWGQEDWPAKNWCLFIYIIYPTYTARSTTTLFRKYSSIENIVQLL